MGKSKHKRQKSSRMFNRQKIIRMSFYFHFSLLITKLLLVCNKKITRIVNNEFSEFTCNIKLHLARLEDEIIRNITVNEMDCKQKRVLASTR